MDRLVSLYSPSLFISPSLSLIKDYLDVAISPPNQRMDRLVSLFSPSLFISLFLFRNCTYYLDVAISPPNQRMDR